jgi:hypothetical protein
LNEVARTGEAVFFKSKITSDAFANCLVRDHQAIFGMKHLVHICGEFDLHFRDESSNIEAFYEFQAFGLYAIADGVRTQCRDDLRDAILASLNQRYADVSGPNWEMICRRVAEYEESGNHAPNGGLAAQRIFERPPGIIQPDSMEAFGLSRAMTSSYRDALQAVERLFKQYTVVVYC